MKTTNVTWRGYQSLVKRLVDQNKKKAAKIGPVMEGLLFRGQSKGDWPLETSLERDTRIKNGIPIGSYNAAVMQMGTLMKGFVEDLPDFERGKIDFPAAQHLRYFPPQNVELAVFLRHHGFPSPLLDWSRSPYIAAYFAFRDKHKVRSKSAIYCLEKPRTTSGEAGFELHSVGPFIAAGRRHTIQQAEYTWCSRAEGESAYFDSHEKYLKGALHKILISSEHREEALADLHSMNINEFSLFGTTDALVKTSLKLLKPQGF